MKRKKTLLRGFEELPIFKLTVVWCGLLVVAIINGNVREKLVVQSLGSTVALPLSGVFLSALIFLAGLVILPWLGRLTPIQYWLAGGFLVVLTILFETLFGYYVIGHPWKKLLRMYNFTTGDLWLLVVATIFMSPVLPARAQIYLSLPTRVPDWVRSRRHS